MIALLYAKYFCHFGKTEPVMEQTVPLKTAAQVYPHVFEASTILTRSSREPTLLSHPLYTLCSILYLFKGWGMAVKIIKAVGILALATGIGFLFFRIRLIEPEYRNGVFHWNCLHRYIYEFFHQRRFVRH
jgi:hypothetical protein